VPASTIAPNPARAQAEEAYSRLQDQVQAVRESLGSTPTPRQLNTLMDLEGALKEARHRWLDVQTEPHFVTTPRDANRGRGDALAATTGLAPAAGTSAPANLARYANSALNTGGLGALVGSQADTEDATDINLPTGGTMRFSPSGARIGAVAGMGLGLAGARLARGEGGALATFGFTPEGGGPASAQIPGLNTPALRQAGVKTQQVQQAVTQAAQEAEQRGVSALDWIRLAGYSGIFGPATATVNVGGAAANLAKSVPKEFVRAAVRGEPAEYMPMALATFRAIPEMFTGLLSAAVTSHPGSVSSRIGNLPGKVLAYAMERPGALFGGAPDALFRPMFDYQGLYREAAQAATAQKAKGIGWWQAVEDGVSQARAFRAGEEVADPELAERIADGGKAYADRMLFQGKIGGIGKEVQDLANHDGFAGLLGNFLLPFSGTPYHMAMRSIEGVPGSAVVGRFRGQQPTRFDLAYDQIEGAVVIGGLAYVASQGRLTGPGPDDSEKRQQMISQGWSPHSIAIGGTPDPNDPNILTGAYYVPTRWFGQYQPVLDAAGSAHDAIAFDKPDAKPGAILGQFIKGGRDVVTNMVWLQGLTDILAATDARDPTSGLPNYLARTALRYTPGAAVARTVASSEDSYQRRPSRSADVGFGEAFDQVAAQSVPSGLAALSPVGTRQDLRPRLDVLGRPVENTQQGIAAVLPRITRGQQDPIINAFEQAGVDISRPRTEVTVSGVKIQLTPEEQDRFTQLRGEQLIRMVGPRVQNGSLGNLRPAGRTEMLTSMLDMANETAQNRLLGEMKDRNQRVRDARMAEQAKKAS
jgi:hypothetical protein